ncbi:MULTISPECIES: TIM barrel protein [unclassified Brenneria]|uniref:TIM barrel protein n=1 Tax=unclassified Brenneria TaxID=2634434 RepID=UPI001554A86F|nr:TIM barrel protein [Brenneria sp. hezel4-2-4]MEE3650356.1 TIM barrel protein [Brenneria sp. HEZEL_4_2_4]NPD00312.1 TIM barrel protein [Brenneria sp. hezel4-2-4]
MTIHIANAPCSWGVDDPKNPNLPPWEKVLKEASQAGYKSIELGPWTYLPTDAVKLTEALNQYQLSIVAGTIFDDLVSEANFDNMIELTHNLCRNLAKIPTAQKTHGNNYPAPYLVIIDFGDAERARYAGHSDKAPRLSAQDWRRMMDHIKQISQIAWNEYGVRPVIHPHAGGCIEFADEIDRLAKDIPHDIAGLCLDTGHLYYSGMDPVTWLTRHFARLDYIHFKDVNEPVHKDVLRRGLDFFAAAAEGVMCPIGKGAIDYPAVKALLVEREYQGWITIEQERDPRQAEGSLRDVTESLHYLKAVGF